MGKFISETGSNTRLILLIAYYFNYSIVIMRKVNPVFTCLSPENCYQFKEAKVKEELRLWNFFNCFLLDICSSHGFDCCLSVWKSWWDISKRMSGSHDETKVKIHIKVYAYSHFMLENFSVDQGPQSHPINLVVLRETTW